MHFLFCVLLDLRGLFPSSYVGNTLEAARVYSFHVRFSRQLPMHQAEVLQRDCGRVVNAGSAKLSGQLATEIHPNSRQNSMIIHLVGHPFPLCS